MRILVLEAYDGGSHKQFLDGLIGHSRHEYHRLGMPARKWKWRMRGSALWFAEHVRQMSPQELAEIEVILTSDMTAVADLRALLPAALRERPVVCFFHENQLTYPVPGEQERDYQYGFTNITSALAADAVWFNSGYHRRVFLEAAEQLLRRMPDCVPAGIAEAIARKSRVMPLGLESDVFAAEAGKKPEGPPVVLWNHRWEFDKNPDVFFETLFDLDRAGVDFRLIVAGETFRESPPIFAASEKMLQHRIAHFGYAPTRAAYVGLLRQADVVVSTAIHEFFGLSVLEAMAAGCLPLLPKRLSYPELLPETAHETCIYENDVDLKVKLAKMCQEREPAHQRIRQQVFTHIKPFRWDHLIETYDRALKNL